MDIALIGFGNVGQGLIRILRDKATFLQDKHGFSPRVVAVVTGSRGSLVNPQGLDLNALQEIGNGALSAYPETDGLIRDWDALKIARESSADVLVEASPTNLNTAEPALSVCYAALDSGKHVVMANKGPVALAYDELMARAELNGVQCRFEATVMAGTPAIRLVQESLAGCTIQSVRGILNGTTNYILTRMEHGMDYENALEQAQKLGYAESDPTADVDGWDAASKAVILAACVFGQKISLDTMAVSGISHLTADDIEAARRSEERWKLIAEVTAGGAKVEAMRLPISHPLANVMEATNAITYTTDLLGDVTLVGAGAGRVETGFGLLNDLIALQT